MNSIKFKASLFPLDVSTSKRMHKYLRFVVILPLEKCKLADNVDVKFFVGGYFSLQEKEMTVQLSMRIIQSNTKLPL